MKDILYPILQLIFVALLFLFLGTVNEALFPEQGLHKKGSWNGADAFISLFCFFFSVYLMFYTVSSVSLWWEDWRDGTGDCSTLRKILTGLNLVIIIFIVKSFF